MNREDLAEVLRLHKLWLEKHPDGKRADFAGADLRRSDLEWANLECKKTRARIEKIIRGDMPLKFYSDKEFERINQRNKKRKERIKHNQQLGEVRLAYALKVKEKQEEIKNANNNRL